MIYNILNPLTIINGDNMFNFKDEIVNSLTEDEQLESMTAGFLRTPIYKFGTELKSGEYHNGVKCTYEVEYLSEAKTAEHSRLLWMRNDETGEYLPIPEELLSANKS